MSEKITPEIAERIRELCRKISVAHNLDEEIQAELYSHMEDKLLGYLSGKEKVTEEDAFILVREHFGKPEYIRSLLEEVHAGEAHISFVRKLGAIFILSFLTTYLMKGFLDLTFWMIYTIFRQYGQFINTTRGECISAFILPFLLSFSLFGYMIYRWRKGMESGKKQWFETLNPWLFLMLVLLLTCILPLIFFIKVVPPHYQNPFWTGSFQKLEHSVYFVSRMILCLAWIWWFNKPLRRLRFTLLGFFTWYYLYMAWLSIVSAIGIMARQEPEKTIHYFIQFTSMYPNIFHSSPLHMIKYEETQCGLAAVGLFLMVTKILDWRRKAEVVIIPR